MTPQWDVHVRSLDKLNTQYLHLQINYEHQGKQGADLLWKILIFQTTWPFDHVSNVRSQDNLKNFYFHYRKTYDQ